MRNNILTAGFSGGLVMIIWIVISNAMLPLKSNMIHKIAPNQLEIHRVLKDNITEAGTYACPYLTPEDEALLPDYRNQPVYSITYSGGTHGDPASLSMLVPILIIFVTSLMAAWMLSKTSRKVLAKYSRRVIFVVGIGVIIAMFDDILQMSFGPQPKDYLVFLAANHVITWVLAGLVIAWRVKPVRS